MNKYDGPMSIVFVHAPEPGPGRADGSVDSRRQADSATEIPKSKSESMKVVQDKV